MIEAFLYCILAFVVLLWTFIGFHLLMIKLENRRR